MKSNFENLDVYRLAEEISDSVWLAVKDWPHFAQDTVGKQLVRAADSIGANIAEGTGRGTYRENCQFIQYARGSLYETKYWLRRAFRRNLLTPPQVDGLKPKLEELTPRLNAYLKSIRRNVVPRRKSERTTSN